MYLFKRDPFLFNFRHILHDNKKFFKNVSFYHKKRRLCDKFLVIFIFVENCSQRIEVTERLVFFAMETITVTVFLLFSCRVTIQLL